MRFNAPRHSFQQQSPVAEKIKATVKWFDPNKGFGFVAPDDGSPDAFLPASAVTAVGYDRLPEGSTVQLDAEALVVNITNAPTAADIEAELAEAEAEVGIEPTLAEGSEDAEDEAAEGAEASDES